MTVMEYMNAHREDMEPCECVILPDGSVEGTAAFPYQETGRDLRRRQTDTEQPYGEKYGAHIFHGGVYRLYVSMEHPCSGAFPSHSGTGRDTGEPVFCGDACSGLSQRTGRTDL